MFHTSPPDKKVSHQFLKRNESTDYAGQRTSIMLQLQGASTTARSSIKAVCMSGNLLDSLSAKISIQGTPRKCYLCTPTIAGVMNGQRLEKEDPPLTEKEVWSPPENRMPTLAPKYNSLSLPPSLTSCPMASYEEVHFYGNPTLTLEIKKNELSHEKLLRRMEIKANQIRNSGILYYIFQPLPMGGTNKHDSSFSNGTTSMNFSFCANLINNNDLRHVVLHCLNHDSVLHKGSGTCILRAPPIAGPKLLAGDELSKRRINEHMSCNQCKIQ
ncbi:P-loop containing nucleoside triphosphate hydrolases superfamily protein [Actinidia rufa]|uniref:P-loop containing nucleoside triphosphate hydrolases superfamily protein n=1 Tax=Actinidia rufa TaxID=165716 RepID=A0A7J0GFV7_9ERIC|nr:P-loop containing nucleoside triphosphate hydrolases superfamily protein [Actinidia rufa]